MNTKESWYKSNFIVEGSNFNFPYYKTQAEKCLVNSNFNSKGRFLDFFAKWRKKGKFKFYSQNCIPDPLNWSYKILRNICWKSLQWSQKYLENLHLEIQHAPRNKNRKMFFQKISFHLQFFGIFIRDSFFFSTANLVL